MTLSKLEKDRIKREEIKNKFFIKDGIEGSPRDSGDPVSSNLFMNRHLIPFYDPEIIKTDNGEKLLILLVNSSNAMMNRIGDTHRYSLIDDPKAYYREGSIIHTNLITNPVTFALQDTVLADDHSLRTDKVFKERLKEIAGRTRYGSDTELYYTERDDTYTLYNNDDVFPIVCNHHITDRVLPLIQDHHGNIFFLQPQFAYLDVTLNNVSELITKGLEGYMESRQDSLPILSNYLNFNGVDQFDISSIKDKSIDIRNDKEFHKKFSEVFDSVRVKSFYKYGEKKTDLRNGYHKRKNEGAITRFTDENGDNFIILPSLDQFSRDKRTMDIITGRALNKLTVSNMDSFINKTNTIYYVGNDKNSSNIGESTHDDLFLYKLIRNDAMSPTIELYLYSLYAKENDIDLYHEFIIRDNGGRGKKRIINAPNDELKEISKKINRILSRSVDRIAMNRNLDNVMIGYRRGKNIQDNALIHANNRSIIKADFSGYFDSIRSEQCVDIFKFLARPSRVIYSENSKRIIRENKLDESYAVEIDHLFTSTLFNPKTNGLYMGNPVSGAMSNLVIMKVVKLIDNICKNKDIEFSIYADDLTFSIKNNNSSDNRTLNKEYIEYIINYALEFYGMDMDLKVNPEKTIRMKNQKRRITGIRINDENEITWDRHKYRQMRVIFHKLSIGVPIEELSMNKNQLKGNINFFKYTENRNSDHTGKEVDIKNSKMGRLMKKYKDTLINNDILSQREYDSMFHVDNDEEETKNE